MTAIQKTVAIATLVSLAIFLHITFCEWETGAYHRHIWPERAGSSGLLPIGPFAGIYVRSLNTFTVDAVLGVAVPIALVGWAGFVLAAPARDAPSGQCDENRT